MTYSKLTLILVSLLSLIVGCERNNGYDLDWRFEELREEIFELPDLGILLEGSDRLAIKMETGLDESCDSLTAAFDGTLSLTFSNGGGILGAGLHREGADMAVEFLQFSERFEEELEQLNEFPLPRRGMVRFYIIKQDTTLGGEFKIDELRDNRSKLSPLFRKAQELVEHIHAFDENKKIDEVD